MPWHHRRRTRRPAHPRSAIAVRGRRGRSWGRCACPQRLRPLPLSVHSHRREGRRWSLGGRGSGRCRGLQLQQLRLQKRRRRAGPGVSITLAGDGSQKRPPPPPRVLKLKISIKNVLVMNGSLRDDVTSDPVCQNKRYLLTKQHWTVALIPIARSKKPETHVGNSAQHDRNQTNHASRQEEANAPISKIVPWHST